MKNTGRRVGAAHAQKTMGARHRTQAAPDAIERPAVMVVDDDEDLLGMAKLVLERNGFHVETRSASPDWQDLQRSAPAVVFMDVGLGNENGMEACMAIKSNNQFAGLPVILISGQGELRLKEEADRCHADGFMSKPFSSELLVKLARHYATAEV